MVVGSGNGIVKQNFWRLLRKRNRLCPRSWPDRPCICNLCESLSAGCPRTRRKHLDLFWTFQMRCCFTGHASDCFHTCCIYMSIDIDTCMPQSEGASSLRFPECYSDWFCLVIAQCFSHTSPLLNAGTWKVSLASTCSFRGSCSLWSADMFRQKSYCLAWFGCKC